jgi:hypothetical protein
LLYVAIRLEQFEGALQRSADLPFLQLPAGRFAWRWLKEKTAGTISGYCAASIKRKAMPWQPDPKEGFVRCKRFQVSEHSLEPRFYGEDVFALAKFPLPQPLGLPVGIAGLDLHISVACPWVDVSPDSIQRLAIPWSTVPRDGRIRSNGRRAQRVYLGADIERLFIDPVTKPISPELTANEEPAKRSDLSDLPLGVAAGGAALSAGKLTLAACGTFWDGKAGFSSACMPVAADLPGFSLTVKSAAGGKMLPPAATSGPNGKTEKRSPAGLPPSWEKPMQDRQVPQRQEDTDILRHAPLRGVTREGRQGDANEQQQLL